MPELNDTLGNSGCFSFFELEIRRCFIEILLRSSLVDSWKTIKLRSVNNSARSDFERLLIKRVKITSLGRESGRFNTFARSAVVRLKFNYTFAPRAVYSVAYIPLFVCSYLNQSNFNGCFGGNSRLLLEFAVHK